MSAQDSQGSDTLALAEEVDALCDRYEDGAGWGEMTPEDVTFLGGVA